MASASTVNWPAMASAMVLVLVRISGLMVFAPFFSSDVFPRRVKAMFAITVAWALAPVISALPMAHSEISFSAILGELAVGLIYGLVLMMLNEVMIFAGQIMGIQFSFSLVNLLDPNTQVETALLGQLFSVYGTFMLVTAGLHRTLLAAFMRTFAIAPVGAVAMDAKSGAAIVAMFGGVLLAGLQLAAPVLAATFLVEMAIALLGRMSPQIPVLSFTVPAKTMIGFVLLVGSLALWPRFVEMHFNALLDQATLILQHCVVKG
jgi:flagellar biosynthesis protein FliR